MASKFCLKIHKFVFLFLTHRHFTLSVFNILSAPDRYHWLFQDCQSYP